jgi:hypothetical protein
MLHDTEHNPNSIPNCSGAHYATLDDGIVTLGTQDFEKLKIHGQKAKAAIVFGSGYVPSIQAIVRSQGF